MRRSGELILLAAFLLVGVWALGFVRRERAPAIPAVERWLNAEPQRRASLAELDAYLTAQGVGGVVPTRDLLLADGPNSRRCRSERYAMPPRSLWPAIIPALRLVRDQAIPAVGRVQVVSVFRTPELNRCGHGAPQSRHLRFAALDLVPLDTANSRDAFTRLCQSWRRAGPRSGWGLGAYFDAARPQANSVARFHVDGTGWRTWGFSKRAASSGCHQLR